MKPLCIYHGNCADGFGAAWVVRRFFNQSSVAREIDFHAGVYQQPPPDVTGREVIIVDFSYKYDVLVDMSFKASSITVLDHHKTAAEDLGRLPFFKTKAEGTDHGREAAKFQCYTQNMPDIAACFDMERSGAGLAWDYFFPNYPRPALIDRIEDRDLWRFAYSDTRAVQAAVFSHPYDFTAWDALFAAELFALAKDGEAIERKHFKDVNELIGVVTRRMNIGGYNVPIANLPYIHVSDAAHALCKGEPFAGCYWDTPKGRVFGLRSTDEGVDVSEIAKQYGGGGHRNASGFTVSYDKAREFEASSTS